LWGPDTPRFVADYRMFGSAGLLYPALLGLVWRLTAGLARFALPEFDGVSNCERLGGPTSSSGGNTASSPTGPTGQLEIAGSSQPNRTERSRARNPEDRRSSSDSREPR
jgi:hypothetical protein